MDRRQSKGMEIAARVPLEPKNGVWTVPSQTSSVTKYRVVLGDKPSCTCEDFQTHLKLCKHIWAAKFTLEREKGKPAPKLGSAEQRKTYRQDWPNYNKAQTHEKEQFQILLHDLCRGLETQPPGRRGGRPRLPFQDVVFSIVYKVYSTFSGRRFMTDLRDAVKAGRLSQACHYNSLSNYLCNKALTDVLTQLVHESSRPLAVVETKFAVDATGIGIGRYRRWFHEKDMLTREARQWVKLHLTCGVVTNIVTAVEVTGGSASETPRFPGLVNETAKRFRVLEVSADKAFLTEDNLKAVDELGGKPFIPFKSNSNAERRDGIWKKMLLC